MLHDVDDDAVEALVQSNLITRAVGVLEHLSSLLVDIKIGPVHESMEEVIGMLPVVFTTQLEALAAMTISEKISLELLS